VLAIPGALLATLDLVKRMELKPKVERLLAWVRRRRSEDPTIEVTLRLGDGRALRLDAAGAAEVLDALAQAQVEAPEAAAKPPQPGS
jgi:hypothetical protein